MVWESQEVRMMSPRPQELTSCGRRPVSSTERSRADFQTRCPEAKHLTLRTAEPGSVRGTHTAIPIGSWEVSEADTVLTSHTGDRGSETFSDVPEGSQG